MWWIFSFLGANWAMAIAVVLAVVVLGAIAFFLKNWKAALAAICLIGASFVFQQIDRNAYQRRVNEEARERVKLLAARAKLAEEIADLNMARAERDAKTIEDLERKASETPADDGVCLDAAAAGRVRDIK